LGKGTQPEEAKTCSGKLAGDRGRQAMGDGRIARLISPEIATHRDELSAGGRELDCPVECSTELNYYRHDHQLGPPID
jgi:hypothetical protein